jgi:hypothetical protein
MIGVAVKHVQSHFGLRKELLPMVDGEARVRASENAQEMAVERLDLAFGSVGAIRVGRNLLKTDGFAIEEREKLDRGFVICRGS